MTRDVCFDDAAELTTEGALELIRLVAGVVKVLEVVSTAYRSNSKSKWRGKVPFSAFTEATVMPPGV